jgi:hypothetical protein
LPDGASEFLFEFRTIVAGPRCRNSNPTIPKPCCKPCGTSADAAMPYLKRHLPNTQVQLMGGHFMFWEYPEDFNAILESYLEELS